MFNRIYWYILLAMLVVLPPSLSISLEESQKTIPLADFKISQLIYPEHYELLGLTGANGAINLSSISGDLLVLEFFNSFCLSCNRQAPNLQEFASKISNSEMKGAIKILTIGVGNNSKMLMKFSKNNSISYPMAPDPNMETYEAIGDPGGTPYTLFLLKINNQWAVAHSTIGVHDAESLMDMSVALLDGYPGNLDIFKAANLLDKQSYLLSPDEEKEHALSSLIKALGKKVFLKEIVADNTKLYQAVDGNGNSMGYFAVVAFRAPVCDLCHSITFALVFDEDGIVRGYKSINVTKYGNELWSEADSEKASSRLMGRDFDNLDFDADVDAVTSATMSSTLIFDEARKVGRLIEKLKNK